MKRDQHAAHSALVNEILLYLGGREDMLVKRVLVGKFRRIKGDPTVYSIGTPGEPDIQGTYAAWRLGKGAFGHSFAIECKTGKGALSKAQQRWRSRFESVGGFYILARDIADIRKIWPD